MYTVESKEKKPRTIKNLLVCVCETPVCDTHVCVCESSVDRENEHDPAGGGRPHLHSSTSGRKRKKD